MWAKDCVCSSGSSVLVMCLAVAALILIGCSSTTSTKTTGAAWRGDTTVTGEEGNVESVVEISESGVPDSRAGERMPETSESLALLLGYWFGMMQFAMMNAAADEPKVVRDSLATAYRMVVGIGRQFGIEIPAPPILWASFGKETAVRWAAQGLVYSANIRGPLFRTLRKKTGHECGRLFLFSEKLVAIIMVGQDRPRREKRIRHARVSAKEAGVGWSKMREYIAVVRRPGASFEEVLRALTKALQRIAWNSRTLEKR